MTDPFESRIEELAGKFHYPPVPRLDMKVMAKLRTHGAGFSARRLTWGIAVLLALFAGLMAVPSVRAAVLEFIQIGVVRIFPAPSLVQTSDVPFAPTAFPGVVMPVTATPGPTASSALIPILEKIAGETTLEEARQKVAFPILLPTYPGDLGQPNLVFLQNPDKQMVVLVWLDPAKPDQIRMSLHVIQAESWMIKKFEPTVIEETTVNGQPAVWTVGPYPLLMQNGAVQMTRLIDGNVLIWAEGDLTYRLETDMDLNDAVKVAESLKPFP